MKQRCYNSNNVNYKSYGARGIRVCDRWLNSYENFIKDMGDRPEGKSLDRIDNDGDYTPKNCRWATRKEQMNNMQRHRGVERSFMATPSRVGKAIFGVYVPQELADRVKKYMAKEKRTLTYVVSEAVDKFLKDNGY